MKNLLLLIFLTLGISNALMAQIESNIEQPISINDTGALPDSSAILDVNAMDRGLLIPRMSSTDRLSISNPADGLIVYDMTMKVPCHYTGTVWRCIEIPACFTLDNSYDCGGPGFGRVIGVDSGAVTLTGTATTTSTLAVTSSSTAVGSSFRQSGMGPVASFGLADPMSPSAAVSVMNAGLGIGHFINNINPMNVSNGLQVDHAGMGSSAFFNSFNLMNPFSTMQADQFGIGSAGVFNTLDLMNLSSTLNATQFGLGDGGHFSSLNPANVGATVRADQLGMGYAGYFESFDVGNILPTVEAKNNGKGDGIHGIAVDSAFTTSGVTGTGRFDAANAAALNAHDGAIRVSKTNSPDTPADFIDINLTSWLPMEDCAAACSPIGASNVYAYNSDVIFIPNVYADPARSVIIHTVEQTDPSLSPLLFVRALTRTVVPGGFSVQFILDMNQCAGLCAPPGFPVRLHYLIINK